MDFIMNISIANRLVCVLLCIYGVGQRHYADGLSTYLYLTNWGAIMALLTMLSGLFLEDNFNLRRRLVSISWCAVFVITVLYWGYLYNFDLLEEPVGVKDILMHGGFLPFLMIEYINLGSTPSPHCEKDILYFAVIYVGCVLFPFGVTGHPIYPGTSFNNLLSFALPAAAYVILLMGYFLLKQINSKTANAFLVNN